MGKLKSSQNVVEGVLYDEDGSVKAWAAGAASDLELKQLLAENALSLFTHETLTFQQLCDVWDYHHLEEVMGKPIPWASNESNVSVPVEVVKKYLAWLENPTGVQFVQPFIGGIKHGVWSLHFPVLPYRILAVDEDPEPNGMEDKPAEVDFQGFWKESVQMPNLKAKTAAKKAKFKKAEIDDHDS